MTDTTNINWQHVIISSLFQNSWVAEHLVLKGGNALSATLQVNNRMSVDFDLSLSLGPEIKLKLSEEVEKALETGVADFGLSIFDYKFEEKPEKISPELKSFWGGAQVTFKIIEQEKFLKHDIEHLRRECIQYNNRGSIQIDISYYEYCGDTMTKRINGVDVHSYSKQLMIAEKLRALCQQLPEYAVVVKRNRESARRCRDYYDLYSLTTEDLYILDRSQFLNTLKRCFMAKRVPLNLLAKLHTRHDFHAEDYQSLRDTVENPPSFDELKEHLDAIIGHLKGLWDI